VPLSSAGALSVGTRLCLAAIAEWATRVMRSRRQSARECSWLRERGAEFSRRILKPVEVGSGRT
jgi:hypothetical protein